MATQNSYPANSGYQGSEDNHSDGSEYNALSFLVRQILATINGATLVQVMAVTNNGALAPVGSVDVMPLVNQLDGSGNAIPHGTIFGVPYFRLQGGTNAVIIDPVVGDIGIAIFADRDISSVKVNKAQSNPGSRRKFDMADGLYIGGFLNALPAQVVRFASDGIHLTSPSAVFIEAPVANFTGDIHATGEVIRGYGTGDQVSLGTHKHPTAAPGAPSPPTPGT